MQLCDFVSPLRIQIAVLWQLQHFQIILQLIDRNSSLKPASSFEDPLVLILIHPPHNIRLPQLNQISSMV